MKHCNEGFRRGCYTPAFIAGHTSQDLYVYCMCKCSGCLGAPDKYPMNPHDLIHYSRWVSPAPPVSAPRVSEAGTHPAPGTWSAPPADCPECYGTGYWRGFGGPCNKGCKVVYA